MALSPKKARRIIIATLSSLFAFPLLFVGCFVIIMAKFGYGMSGAGAGSDLVVAAAEFRREMWFAAMLICGGLCLSGIAVWGWVASRCN